MSAQPDPVPKVRLKAATALDSISSTLAGNLPYKQAEGVTNARDTASNNSESDLESRPTSAFVWDKLPGEIKNEIYKLLLVADVPIRPYNGTRSHSKRQIAYRKQRIHGKILWLSKRIYQEALPILLGDKIFVLNAALGTYLGFRSKPYWRRTQYEHHFGPSPPDRAAMIRKVVTTSCPSDNALLILCRLDGLKELIFAADSESEVWQLRKFRRALSSNDIDTQESEKLCADQSDWFSSEGLVDFVHRRPKTLVHLIAFQDFEDLQEMSASPAICWTTARTEASQLPRLRKSTS